MLDNHQSLSAPPRLSAAKQIIADLTEKSKNEEECGKDLQRLLTESQDRKSTLDTTILNLRAVYGLIDKPNPDPSLSTPPALKVVDTSENESLPDSSSQAETTPPADPQRSWEKPNNVSWIELLTDMMKAQGNLITNQEVPKYLNMDDAAKKKHHQTISGTFAYYRGMGQIISILVYQRTPNGKAISQYFNGIPEFFDDVEKQQLKPDYEAAFKDKIRKFGFFLTEEEAIRS